MIKVYNKHISYPFNSHKYRSLHQTYNSCMPEPTTCMLVVWLMRTVIVLVKHVYGSLVLFYSWSSLARQTPPTRGGCASPLVWEGSGEWGLCVWKLISTGICTKVFHSLTLCFYPTLGPWVVVTPPVMNNSTLGAIQESCDLEDLFWSWLAIGHSRP